MTTFTAADGSITITTEQAARALSLFDKLMEPNNDPKRAELEADLEPARVLDINMGVALGHALEMTEQEALNHWINNEYYQRLCDALIMAYFEDKIIKALQASLS